MSDINDINISFKKNVVVVTGERYGVEFTYLSLNCYWPKLELFALN